MKVVSTITQVREQIKEWRRAGYTIGFVPTMGYLHSGHASLVKASVKECDKTVVSIFVNPTQFAPGEDVEKYPRDYERDCKILEENNCDMLFCPEAVEIYPDGFATYVELKDDIPTKLCGESRPTHFLGVCTVVTKLFNIVSPNKAYFGEKDAQQLVVVKKMVADMAMNVEVVGCPIIREEDGLAKSSRNAYLSEEERKAAIVLYKSILIGKEAIRQGEFSCEDIVGKMVKCIEKEPLAKIDYVSAVNNKTMEPIESCKNGGLFAIAVYIGKTRLLDNFTVDNLK